MARKKDRKMNLWTVSAASRVDFASWAHENRSILEFRRLLEADLELKLPQDGRGICLGYCWVCAKHSHFTYDRGHAGTGTVNWRESLVCKTCGLANRLRLSIHVIDELVDSLAESTLYLTEQVTPAARALRSRCAALYCSEFLGQDVERGAISAQGVRNEDLTCLTFSDGQFDAVLSFDVFEHIPDFRAALREVRRVLKPGGTFLMSVPFAPASDANVVRARLHDGGVIEHLLPPEYHGDPVNVEGGVLCYYHFGWELLHDMRAAGFIDANVHFWWSSDYAYLGPEQSLLVARA